MKPKKQTAKRYVTTAADVERVWKQRGMRYLIDVSDIPREPLPNGQVLVHSHIRPHKKVGGRGFRAWTQTLNDRLEVCPCDWAGVDLHGLKHYRMKAK
jgi:hypothetical protein